ncbi:aspartate dehydrogenase [Pantoea sp. 1.19]|uniref:aspartate dehydrogenase n=1 Tax=Pantoea sp. 1.19 TaxID=1925589 RepID=UPI0009489EA2|nr:aspartate dehydrogenase [Pantoea sp. 1.19]
MKTVMLIGYGAMAHDVLARLPEGVSVRWIVAREAHHAAILQQGAGTIVPLTTPQACMERPDLVLECASQQAVAEYGPAILQRGWRLALISTGALADAALEARLNVAAAEGGGQLTLLSGAIAGLDGLQAARVAGLERVTYQARKSPASWRGSEAERRIDLASVSHPRCFFEGSAREAATRFPANANVAATLALAGIGLDKTRVELWVDPGIARNVHRINATGPFGDMQLEIRGYPLESNAKTSMLAALSAVSACQQLLQY